MAERDVFQGNDGNFIEFFTKEIKNNVLSEKEGRPIYASQHWVKIWAPGSKDKPEFPMDEIREERYKVAYDTWKARITSGETGVMGTPLIVWPTIDRAMAVGLRDQGILSVEMLAAIKDSDIHRFGPGIRLLRQQAQAFLEAAKGQAPLTALTKQLEDLRAQVAQKDQQMAEVMALVAAKGIDPNASPAAAPVNGAMEAMQEQLAEMQRAMSKMKPERRPYRHHKRAPNRPKAKERIAAETEAPEAA